MDETEGFAFPKPMDRATAQRLLGEAYAELDAGKILRRTNKLLRKRGIDPPVDVEYVAEPALADYEDGLGVSLGSDILIHEEFPEMEQCVQAFEEVLGELLMKRVEKKVRSWVRKNRDLVRPARKGPPQSL